MAATPIAGVYIKFTGPGVTDLVVPYNADSISHTSTQILSQPVSDFFAWLKNAISDVSKASGEIVPGGTVAAEVAEAALQLGDLLGTKFYNKKFFASAWKGAQPSEVSIKVDLSVGWKKEYSGKSEVYDPLKQLYQATLPEEVEVTGFLRSPGPTVIGVAKAFIETYFIKMNAALKTSIDTTLADTRKEQSSRASAGIFGGYWTISLISTDTKDEKIFFKLKDMVCFNAALDLNTQAVDEEGYPLRGSISLSFKSSDITTSAGVNDLMPLGST